MHLVPGDAQVTQCVVVDVYINAVCPVVGYRVVRNLAQQNTGVAAGIAVDAFIDIVMTAKLQQISTCLSNGAHDKSLSAEEPDEAKASRPVLKTSQSGD